MSANFICIACGKEKPQSPRAAGRQTYCGERNRKTVHLIIGRRAVKDQIHRGKRSSILHAYIPQIQELLSKD